MRHFYPLKCHLNRGALTFDHAEIASSTLAVVPRDYSQRADHWWSLWWSFARCFLRPPRRTDRHLGRWCAWGSESSDDASKGRQKTWVWFVPIL